MAENVIKVTTAPQTVKVSQSMQSVKVTGLPGLKGEKGTAGAGAVLQLETLMTAGVLTYSLPDIPPSKGTSVYINGIHASHSVSGVNLTITGYTAGEIDDTDELRVYY